MKAVGQGDYEERLSLEGSRLSWSMRGSLAPDDLRAQFTTDQWMAWSDLGETVGSYSLYGGRALAGTLHHVPSGSRVWRREVSTSDGLTKAILHIWYRGGRRVGAQQGSLQFTPNP